MDQLVKVLSHLTASDEQDVIANVTTKSDTGEVVLKSEKEILDYLDPIFSQKFKEVGESQKKRGYKEALTSFESDFKKRFEFDSDKKGIELIEDYVNSVKSKTNPFDPAEALKHPEVKQIIASKTKEAFDEADRIKSEFESFKNSVAKQEQRKSIDAKAVSVLKAKKAILGDTPEEEAKRLNFFLSVLHQKEFKVEGDDIFPVDQDGEPLTDSRMNRITFDQFVADLNPFGFHSFEPKKPNVPNDVPKKGKSSTTDDLPEFENREQLNLWLNRNRMLPVEQLERAIKQFESKLN